MKTLLTLLASGCIGIVLAQPIVPTIQDCLGARQICQPVYEETAVLTGSGNYSNEINPNLACVQGEIHPIWYEFVPTTSGAFSFQLVPTNPYADYDWALYNLSLGSCADISTNASMLISCNAAGGSSCNGATGITGGSGYVSQGFNCNSCGEPGTTTPAGCSPFNALVPVEAGHRYVLMISNWSQSPHGYTIDFGSATGIGIFDEEAPELTQTTVPEEPGEHLVELDFSERIACASVTLDGFQLVDADGTLYPLEFAVNPYADSLPFLQYLAFELPTDLPVGGYEFRFLNPEGALLLDRCGQPVAPFALPIDLGGPLSVDLGPDQTLCPGDHLVLDATQSGNATYAWNDGSTAPTLTVTAGGTYVVTVTSGSEIGVDTVVVVPQPALTPPVLPDQVRLCAGGTLLDATVGGAATYVWDHDNGSGPTLWVDEPGLYSVRIFSACTEMTLTTEVLPPLDLTIQFETYTHEFCGTPVLLEPHLNDATAQLRWENDTPEPNRLVYRPGVYYLTAWNDCEQKVTQKVVVTACEPSGLQPAPQLPELVSLYGGNLPSEFRMRRTGTLAAARLEVFDLAGRCVFAQDGTDATWTPTAAQTGTYVYRLSYQPTSDAASVRFQSGRVVVVGGAPGR